jgi:phage terminase large subunit-like protein
MVYYLIKSSSQEERPTIETLREYENDYKRFNKDVKSWQNRCNVSCRKLFIEI